MFRVDLVARECLELYRWCLPVPILDANIHPSSQRQADACDQLECERRCLIVQQRIPRFGINLCLNAPIIDVEFRPGQPEAGTEVRTKISSYGELADRVDRKRSGGESVLGGRVKRGCGSGERDDLDVVVLSRRLDFHAPVGAKSPTQRRGPDRGAEIVVDQPAELVELHVLRVVPADSHTGVPALVATVRNRAGAPEHGHRDRRRQRAEFPTAFARHLPPAQRGTPTTDQRESFPSSAQSSPIRNSPSRVCPPISRNLRMLRWAPSVRSSR